MAILSKTRGPVREESMPGFEGRYAEADGTIFGFESFADGGDFTPFYRGLPDDLCQCPHWGYVISGQLTFHRPGGDEVIQAGEGYYTGPGHTAAVAPGTEIIEFSPADEHAKTMEVVEKNLAELA